MHNICKLLLAASLLLGGQVQAQTFEPGYLVTAAGDTLRGELENRFWQEPPTGVVFRAGADQAVQSYVRTQLQSFRLNSGRYFRREVLPVDRAAARQLGNIPSRLIINQQPDTLLAEVAYPAARRSLARRASTSGSISKPACAGVAPRSALM